jgi:hypothetical protein
VKLGRRRARSSLVQFVRLVGTGCVGGIDWKGRELTADVSLGAFELHVGRYTLKQESNESEN